MSTTKHREVAKLDRVPLPVEAARIGATGWQITRTGARVVTKLAGKGSLQQKILKQIPQTFADLGPTYVKFGQIIASSPGAFGEQLSREFRSLLDAVPPADADEVHRLFKEELGDDPANLFATFDDKPFASASIAQVHYATLHSGEEVVVKIQRPGIRRRVAADLQILKRGARLVEFAKLGQRLSAQDVVADFADNLAEELDFRLEAQSMDAWVVAYARLAARQEHPGAPGLLGPDERTGADDGARRGHPHRRRRRDPQGRLRRHRTREGPSVQCLRGWAAARPVPRRPARGQSLRRPRRQDRVPRLRHHGPHRPAHALAAARTGVRAAGQEGPRRSGQDRRADGRRGHHEARGRGRQGSGEVRGAADHVDRWAT